MIILGSLVPDHPDTASIYNNMAAVYRNKGEYSKALEYGGNSLKIRLATLGQQHPDTAGTYNDMAMVHAHLKQYRKCLECSRNCIRAYRATDTSDSRKFIFNSALFYIASGLHARGLLQLADWVSIMMHAADGSSLHFLHTANLVLSNAFSSTNDPMVSSNKCDRLLSSCYLLLGHAMGQCGDHVQAAACFETLLHLEMQVVVELGCRHHSLGRYPLSSIGCALLMAGGSHLRTGSFAVGLKMISAACSRRNEWITAGRGESHSNDERRRAILRARGILLSSFLTWAHRFGCF
jgi:tetratricopeptide (TPR) repeat protein